MVNDISEKIAVFELNKLLILRSLYLCSCDEDICGCDLVAKLGIPKNLLSYHIKQLLDMGYITQSRCGRKKVYKINTSSNNKVKNILEVTELI